MDIFIAAEIYQSRNSKAALIRRLKQVAIPDGNWSGSLVETISPAHIIDLGVTGELSHALRGPGTASVACDDDVPSTGAQRRIYQPFGCLERPGDLAVTE